MTETKGEYSKITWQDVTVKIGTLKPWDGNPKTSTKKDARALLKSWDELGQFQTIAIGPGGDVYDGHQRLSALLLVHGPEYQVAARQSSRPLTDEERRKIAIYSRQIGQWDWDTLSGWEPAELMEWGFDGDLLKDWKRDTAALDNFLKSEQAEPVDAEPQIDRAAELNEKWQVKTGDLWQIGPHRLLCGDSTKLEDVERVMGGERAELLLTDPPYGIGIADNPVRQAHARQDWDNVPANSDNLKSMIDASDKAIIWGGNYYSLPPAQCFYVWDKKQPENFSLAMGELAWSNIKMPAKIYRQSVLSYSKNHPTEKPVDLFIWCCHWYKCSIVFDPFAGSGTTLVACQNLSRVCRAIEISPAYCAVILERMATAFPELEINRL